MKTFSKQVFKIKKTPFKNYAWFYHIKWNNVYYKCFYVSVIKTFNYILNKFEL